MKTSEKIKIILGRRALTLSDLAEKIGSSRQNLSNKFTRNNFSEKELREIATALGCDFDAVFTLQDTGETI
ncbi:MAG: helix-turn-helix transcriptional regulator [Oscillospiraceae bacterium]